MSYTQHNTQPLSYDQTIDILTGPREIPPEVTHTVEEMLTNGEPIVNADRFNQFVTGLTAERPIYDTHAESTFYSIVTLASSSSLMAYQQAGDIQIPRPRRLGEHNQSVLNTYEHNFSAQHTDPRDRLLRPMFALQDAGKAHCVALTDPSNPRRSRNQAVHNLRVAKNVLSVVPEDILSTDEKTVIELLVQQTAVGKALRRHDEKGVPLDDVVTEAQIELNRLRGQCPSGYKDRFDLHLVASYLTDAGAHTQRAYYTDAATGNVVPDVTPRDRYNADGSKTGMTLDHLFSEAPEDRTTLRLIRPKHLAVMEQLFPDLY